jgi:SHS2 domain-containing protein
VGLTPAQAFEQAALALMSIITETKNIAPRTCISFRCEATNLEDLFIDFLNRIIYESDLHKMLFSRFYITMTEHALIAYMWGESIHKERHHPTVEIKGASYHAVTVEQRKNHWYAECVVDV